MCLHIFAKTGDCRPKIHVIETIYSQSGLRILFGDHTLFKSIPSFLVVCLEWFEFEKCLCVEKLGPYFG